MISILSTVPAICQAVAGSFLWLATDLIIDKLNPVVMSPAETPATMSRIEKIPYSAGVTCRIMIHVVKKPMAFASTSPLKTVETFLNRALLKMPLSFAISATVPPKKNIDTLAEIFY